MANNMYTDTANESYRNQYLQGGDNEQAANEIYVSSILNIYLICFRYSIFILNQSHHVKWLAHRDHISEKHSNENYVGPPTKTKLSHRSFEDHRSKIVHPEANSASYYDEYVKSQRTGTSSIKAKKAIAVRGGIVKQPDSFMKRIPPNIHHTALEIPVQSKISLEKYEKNMASRLDMMKRKEIVNEKINKMVEMKKNKTVNFQNIPIPMEYQEMNDSKRNRASYDDYQNQQPYEDEDLESSEREEVDSFYEDNDQFENDTLSEANSCCHEIPQIRESIANLEIGRDYMYDMMNNTITSLKTHEKVVGNTSKKSDACGAGDSRTNQSGGALMRSDIVIKKIEAVKLDCYKKIENNLIRLKDIDDITTKLYQNYVDEEANNK